VTVQAAWSGCSAVLRRKDVSIMMRVSISKLMTRTVTGLMIFSGLWFGANAFGYGEGPSDSGNFVYGKVTYSDGSTCRNCCGIQIETDSGMSKEGCTNSDGEYKIYVSSKYLKTVYYKGKQWSGDAACSGGKRIDLNATR
jgi:hypothetical protein